MLTDQQPPMKLFVLLGMEMFTVVPTYKRTTVYRVNMLQRFRTLPNCWSLRLACVDAYQLQQAEKVMDLGINALDVLALHEMTTDEQREVAKEAVQSSDLVFAPSFVDVLKVSPHLRSPRNPDQTFAVLEHFGNSGVPYDIGSYYNFLSTL